MILTHVDGELPKNGEIFVFGSNLAGIHGAGAAKVALNKFGAKLKVESGLIGQSYAIPTKDKFLQPLSLYIIKSYVDLFKNFVKENKDKTFFLTRIGCGLAGYNNEEIAPMFKDIKYENVNWPEVWVKIL